MSRIRIPVAVATSIAMQALLWLALPPPAAAQADPQVEAHAAGQDEVPAASPGEVTMDAAANAAARAEPADPALQAWREEVLPGIRELLAAGRRDIAAAAAVGAGHADPGQVREANRRLEALKLDLERQVLGRQLQWARTWQKSDLEARLADRISAVTAAVEGVAP
jgi:hypothetical protein